MVQISDDGGATWVAQSFGQDQTSYTFTYDTLIPGEVYQAKVIVTDGVLTAETLSEPFVAPWRVYLPLVQREW
jgi:hypothetical protein